jgi:hypothetical protein
MIKKTLKKVAKILGGSVSTSYTDPETILLAVGSMLTKQQYLMNSENINDYEFKIFSQFGDDGIIQYLVKNVFVENNVFIEFGVGNYLESNTRFLLMNNNWAGFVMDSSTEAIDSLKKQNWYWKYGLTQKTTFITKENINELMSETGFLNIGLLHIDIDGNDYHILTEIDLSKLNPSIIIMEYNSVFGSERAITVPYRKDFIRTKAHYSNLFFGASLAALNYAALKKGYRLIGGDLVGNNAFFVRQDLLNEKVKEVSVKSAYKESLFRESRNKDYSVSLLRGNERLELIKGLEVINVITNEKEKL